MNILYTFHIYIYTKTNSFQKLYSKFTVEWLPIKGIINISIYCFNSKIIIQKWCLLKIMLLVRALTTLKNLLFFYSPFIVEKRLNELFSGWEKIKHVLHFLCFPWISRFNLKKKLYINGVERKTTKNYVNIKRLKNKTYSLRMICCCCCFCCNLHIQIPPHKI